VSFGYSLVDRDEEQIEESVQGGLSTCSFEGNPTK